MDDEREQELGQEIVPGVADLDMQTLAAQLVALLVIVRSS